MCELKLCASTCELLLAKVSQDVFVNQNFDFGVSIELLRALASETLTVFKVSWSDMKSVNSIFRLKANLFRVQDKSFGVTGSLGNLFG